MSKFSPLGSRLLLTALAFAVAGCERPFVETDPVVLTETTPDLSVVRTGETLRLRLRVSDAASATRVTVNGEPATRAPEPGLFLDTLRLEPGLNTLFVAVFDDAGNVTEDTLHAVRLSAAVRIAEPPPRFRYEHTATALGNGGVLIAGGFEGPGTNPTALVAREIAGVVTYTPLTDSLRRPRGGHTASLLPDGRVLLLGGATRNVAGDPAQFVVEAEVYDPTTHTFTVVPVAGEPLRRYDHAALVLERDGRVFVYVYGGLEAHAEGAVPTGSLVVLELREEGGEEVLRVVSPPGGIGALPPAHGHALLPLPPQDGLPRVLAVGYDLGGLDPEPFALALTFRPSTTFFPFEITTEAVAPPDTALAQFAAAPALPGLLLFSGGGVHAPAPPDSYSTDVLRVFAHEAGRFFTFPEDVRLLLSRSHHTATLLPSGRILVVGGVGNASNVLAQTELIGLN